MFMDEYDKNIVNWLAKQCCEEAKSQGLYEDIENDIEAVLDAMTDSKQIEKDNVADEMKRRYIAERTMMECRELLGAVGNASDFQSELSDVRIMTLGGARWLGFNAGNDTAAKVADNRRRGYKHGKKETKNRWILHDVTCKEQYECSSCHKHFAEEENKDCSEWNFCPVCGVWMR